MRVLDGDKRASWERRRHQEARDRVHDARLFETNSSRVVNDFADRVLESRRRVQGEMRGHLQAVLASAEHAVARAQELHVQGETTVNERIAKLDDLTRAGVLSDSKR